jgi:hypothetical protein
VAELLDVLPTIALTIFALALMFVLTVWMMERQT